MYENALEDFRRFARVPTVQAAIEDLIARGFSGANTKVTSYRAHMVGVRNAKGQLTKGRGLSSAAVNLRLTVLRSLVKLISASGRIPWQIAVKNVDTETVSDVRGPEPDLLEKMLQSAKAEPGPAGRRNYAILRLAAELGLRRREIAGLDLEDVDLEANTLRILGKRRRQKETISCSRQMSEAIARWREVRPRSREGSPLFTNLIRGRTSRISGAAIYDLIRALGKVSLPRTSSRRIGPHRVRHSAITSAAQRTDNLGDVKVFARHKDARMTARYIDAKRNAQKTLADSIGADLP